MLIATMTFSHWTAKFSMLEINQQAHYRRWGKRKFDGNWFLFLMLLCMVFLFMIVEKTKYNPNYENYTDYEDQFKIKNLVSKQKNHNNQANRYLILLNTNAKSETGKGRLLFFLTYGFFFLKQNTTVKVQSLWPNEKIAEPGVRWKHMQ